MATARELETDYLPIAEHGLVGDLHTIALVGTNGTIDWYCCPSFDSPSVFGAILDKDKGGFYALRPDAEDWDAKQLYFPDTNVLITRFFTEDGVGRGAGLHADRPGRARGAPPPAHAARRRRARARWTSGSRCSRASTTAASSTRSRCTRTGCCSARPT